MNSGGSCQGPRGRITHYQIRLQRGLTFDTENVTITACTAGMCSHAFSINSNVRASYDSVSVAAVNVVGVGNARLCTMQTIRELNFTSCNSGVVIKEYVLILVKICGYMLLEKLISSFQHVL